MLKSCECHGAAEDCYASSDLSVVVGPLDVDTDVAATLYSYPDYVGGSSVFHVEGELLCSSPFNVCHAAGCEVRECVMKFYLCDCVLPTLESLGSSEVSGWSEAADGEISWISGLKACPYVSYGYMLGSPSVETGGDGGAAPRVDSTLGCFRAYALTMTGHDCHFESSTDEKCCPSDETSVCGTCSHPMYDFGRVTVCAICDDGGCPVMLDEYVESCGSLSVVRLY